MTLDDLDLLVVYYFMVYFFLFSPAPALVQPFYSIKQCISSNFWKAATAKRMKIDPNRQRQRLNVPLSIIFRAWIRRRFLRSGSSSYTHCCRALTLALARLACIVCIVIKLLTQYTYATGPDLIRFLVAC